MAVLTLLRLDICIFIWTRKNFTNVIIIFKLHWKHKQHSKPEFLHLNSQKYLQLLPLWKSTSQIQPTRQHFISGKKELFIPCTTIHPRLAWLALSTTASPISRNWGSGGIALTVRTLSASRFVAGDRICSSQSSRFPSRWSAFRTEDCPDDKKQYFFQVNHYNFWCKIKIKWTCFFLSNNLPRTTKIRALSKSNSKDGA